MEPSSSENPIIPPVVPESPHAASTDESSPEEENPAWRDEVAARLSRYRSRRKAPPPRYPSLKLPFGSAGISTRLEPIEPPGYESVSNHALALDAKPLEDPITENPHPIPSPPVETTVVPPVVQSSAKIIEFPRFAWGPPAPPPDQLAEPVMDRPRILDVPELPPPVPALGGITIEPVQREEVAKRPGIDMPLYPAPLGLRIFASLIDFSIVAFASAIFGFVFWKVTAIQPPRLQLFAMFAGIPCVFWAAYQYLLIVYSGSTPGLRAAHLELARFDGAPTRRSVRRWRVLASYLSAASLGMGYTWLFLDEDSLCWHDRITHTYLAPKAMHR